MPVRKIHNSLLLFSIVTIFLVLACSSEQDPAPKKLLSGQSEKDLSPIATVTKTFLPSTPSIPEPKPASRKKYDSPPTMTIDPLKRYTATIVMEKGGEIVIELFPKEAPFTVNSFVFLARDGYYNGVTFHRVIPDFMAQGGDPTGTGNSGPGYEFDNELSPNRRHDSAGVLSMANRGVQNGRGTNGSQFFITLKETSFLDGYDADGTPKNCSARDVSCHTVFGKVVEGMDVVYKLSPRSPGTATTHGDAIEKIAIEETE